MTTERVTQVLYTAVHLVVRRAPPLPSLEAFLDTRVKDVFADPAPTDWPSFWRETLTAVLEDQFRREGVRVDGLDPEFFENRNRRMRSIRDRIAAAIMPLDPRQATPAVAPFAPVSAPAPVSVAKQAPPKRGSASKGSRRASAPAPKKARRTRGGSAVGLSARRLLLALILALVPALLGALGGGVSVALAASTAMLERTPADRPEAADFRYDIVVVFADERGKRVEVAQDLILDPARYELRSSCAPETPIPVARAIWRGVGETEGNSTGAVLYGDLDLACDYSLWIRLPGVHTGRVRVRRPESLATTPARGFVRFVHYVDRHLSGTLDLRTLEDDSARVGIDFDARLDFPVARERLLGDAIRCGVRADGMLAVRKRPVTAHNSVDLAADLSWLRTYTLPGPAPGSRYVHALGLQLSPLGCEADQNFRRIDLTAGPAVTFSIPFLDWPLLFWHRLVSMPRGFLPPTARLGYTYVHRVREGGERRDDRRRADLEVVAVAPILRPLDLLMRHRIFYDFESEERESNTELTWRWYVDADSRTAVLLKLVHGALPPLWNDVEVTSLGLQVGL
jgi:hypothetical protein